MIVALANNHGFSGVTATVGDRHRITTVINSLIINSYMENQKNTIDLKNLWQTILGVSKIVFEISLVVYLALFLIDEIASGFVSNFFNTNYILVICIVFGALTALNQKHEPLPKPEALKKSDYILITGLGILAVILVFVKIKTIGWIAWPISILSGILIFLISYLFLNEDKKEM